MYPYTSFIQAAFNHRKRSNAQHYAVKQYNTRYQNIQVLRWTIGMDQFLAYFSWMRVSNSVFISTMGIYFCCPYPILDAFPLGFCAQDPLINEIPSSLHVRSHADHKPSALKVFHAVPACLPFPVHPKYLAQHQVHCAWITTGHISFRKSVSLKCISYLADAPACEWGKTIKNIYF